jgi:hypothetical protein
MLPPKPPNAAPSESESRALTKLLVDQQRAVAFIKELRKQHDEEHQRLSSKVTLLKETLDSLEILNEKGSKLRSDSIPLLDASSKELLRLTAKRDFLQPLFAGTAAFFDGLSALRKAINLLKLTLKTTLGQLENFLTKVAPEFYSTDMLFTQTTDAISSFSTTAGIIQQSIALKQNGVLHPLRRLPVELLVQIFDCCADEEAQSWIDGSGRVLQTPKVLTRISGVCSRWRSIARSHPGLWSRLLAPRYTNYWKYTRQDRQRTGADHFRHTLPLCQGAKLDLTIPTWYTFPPDIDIKVLELERLNLLDANGASLPIFPSPKQLWLGQPIMNGSIGEGNSTLVGLQHIENYQFKHLPQVHESNKHCDTFGVVWATRYPPYRYSSTLLTTTYYFRCEECMYFQHAVCRSVGN